QRGPVQVTAGRGNKLPPQPEDCSSCRGGEHPPPRGVLVISAPSFLGVAVPTRRQPRPVLARAPRVKPALHRRGRGSTPAPRLASAAYARSLRDGRPGGTRP